MLSLVKCIKTAASVAVFDTCAVFPSPAQEKGN